MSNIKEHQQDGLYFRTWLTNKKKVKGSFIVIHGLGEHCERYDELAAYLNSHGYHVASMDLPCHGRSDGIRGHISSFDEYQDAVLAMIARHSEQYADLPMYLLGHSMGGLIASYLLLNHQQRFSAAMLSGAAIESPQEPNKIQVMILTLLSKVLPTLPAMALDASAISRDPEVVAKYMADPLVSKDKLSAKFLVSMFDAMQTVKRDANRITLPLLVMHGGEDVMTSPAGSEKLYNAVASKQKKLTVYEGLYHEIFNEPERTQVYDDMRQWLEAL